MSATSTTVSITTLVAVLQNLVTALNNETQTYLNVQGTANFSSINLPTVIKPSAGRIASISVTTAGTGTGIIYDGATLTAKTKPMYMIPAAVSTEPYVVNLPLSFGLLIVPGAGQTLAGSYS